VAYARETELEFFFEHTTPSVVLPEKVMPCFQVEGHFLCPSKYLRGTRRRQVGEIDVIPEEGIIERNLAPLMTDMGRT
jgi:hypothetical protein